MRVSARRPMRLATVAAIAGLLGLAPVVAWAEPPQSLGPQLTDLVGAVSGREDEIEAALDALVAEDGVQLFIVYVDSFDGQPAQQWAATTAALSNLGSNDPLLAVALGDRAYTYNVPSDFPLDDETLADIAATQIEPALRENDFAGAAIAAADAYREAIGAPSGWSGGALTWLVAALVAVAVVAGGLWWWRRQGRGGAEAEPTGAAPPMTMRELETTANAALIETDDAIKTSEQEMGFAQAQFGDASTVAFAQAIASARAEMTASFALRQRLDDAEPEAEGQRRAMLEEIIERCTRANGLLDEQAEEFDRLRDLERTAPQTLADLPGRTGAQRSRLDDVRTCLTTMRAAFDAAEVSVVADNPDEAGRRLAFADTEVVRAREAMDAGRTGEAVMALRGAEDAVAQATSLLDAVQTRAQELEQAGAHLPGLRAEIEQELAQARAVHPADVDATAAVGAAEAALAVADELGARAPVTTLRHLQQADQALDQVLAAAVEAGQQRVAAAAKLAPVLQAAQAEVAAVGDFITTRRGAVGAAARTRLSEAERHLEQAVALAESDPRLALTEAQHADARAEQARSLARADVEQAQAAAFLGGGSSGGGLEVGSAILGGILIDSFGSGHGGGSRSGFGDWTGGGSSGRSSGGGSRHVPASFGGSGTRGRRGGGGRF